jgi:competence protein ComEC
VAHLMSISGLHITLFAWLAIRAGGWLWRRSAQLCLWWPAPVAARVLGVGLAALYAVFSGWGVPAQRTVWMLLLVQGLALTGRRWPARTVWLTALALVVAIDPWAMLQPGFWLSFVAVGVLMATDGRDGVSPSVRTEPVEGLDLQEGAPRPLDKLTTGPAQGERDVARSAKIAGWLRTHAAAGWREQWLISLALAPLSLLLFQQVSLSGLLANLLAIPWVTLVVTPLAFVGVLLPGAWTLATWAMQALNAMLGWMAAWPWGVWSLPAAPLPLALAAVLGGVLLVLRWPWHLRALGGVMVLPLLLFEVPRPAPGQYEVLAMDVGQGNAVLVRTATHALLFDAGPRYGPDSDAGHRVVVPLLRALGERPDVMVLSHSDTDHTGGMGAILATQPQMKVLSSMPQPDWPRAEAKMPGVAEPRAGFAAPKTWQRCEQGQAWSWDGVRFEVLHPQPADYERSQKPNAMSCVLRVSAADAPTLLLTGDIEAPQEARLVAQYGHALKADVLLVPHHGSKTSSTPEFLQAVSPQLGLVQAGYRNRFGHPAAPVVERYDTMSVHLVRSDQCGAWWWRSEKSIDAREWCERTKHQRYWHHPNLMQRQDKQR